MGLLLLGDGLEESRLESNIGGGGASLRAYAGDHQMKTKMGTADGVTI